MWGKLIFNVYQQHYKTINKSPFYKTIMSYNLMTLVHMILGLALSIR